MGTGVMQIDQHVERVRHVYQTEHARLWRSVLAFTGSRAVTDDAVAEAFAQVLRRGDAVDDVARWVWSSAFAIARGELKRRAGVHGGDVDDRAAGSGAEIDDDGLRSVLARLGAMSPADRELIVLCHVGGWKPRDLAPIVGVPAGTVRVRLHRATARARELLGEEEPR